MYDVFTASHTDIGGFDHLTYFNKSEVTICGYNTAFVKTHNCCHWLKKINEGWYMHSEGMEPSYEDGRVRFYQNGITTRIEDLPIDEEDKVILLLKYSYDENLSVVFHTYT